MADTVELETLVTKFAADTRDLQSGLASAEATLRATTQAMQQQLNVLEQQFKRSGPAATQGMGQAQAAAASLQQALGQTAQAVQGLAAAFAGGAFLERSLATFKQAETSMVRLTASVEMSGRAVNEAMGEYNAFAASIAATTNASAGQVRGMLAQAEAFGLQGDGAERAARLAIAMGTAQGQGAENSAHFMRMATMAAEGHVEMLRRFVPALRSTHDPMQQQLILQQFINEQMEVAARQTETAAGKAADLAKANLALQASFGKVVAEGIKPLVEMLTEVVKWFTALPDEVKKNIVVVLGLATAMGTLATVLGAVGAVKALSAIGVAATATTAQVAATTTAIGSQEAALLSWMTASTAAQTASSGFMGVLGKLGLLTKVGIVPALGLIAVGTYAAMEYMPRLINYLSDGLRLGFGAASDAADKFNSSLAATADATKEAVDKRVGAAQRGLANAQGITDPAAREAALQAEKVSTARQLAAAQANVANTQRLLNNTGGSFLGINTNSTQENQRVASLQVQLREAQREARLLEGALKGVDEAIAGLGELAKAKIEELTGKLNEHLLKAGKGPLEAMLAQIKETMAALPEGPKKAELTDMLAQAPTLMGRAAVRDARYKARTAGMTPEEIKLFDMETAGVSAANIQTTQENMMLAVLNKGARSARDQRAITGMALRGTAGPVNARGELLGGGVNVRGPGGELASDAELKTLQHMLDLGASAHDIQLERMNQLSEARAKTTMEGLRFADTTRASAAASAFEAANLHATSEEINIAARVRKGLVGPALEAASANAELKRQADMSKEFNKTTEAFRNHAAQLSMTAGEYANYIALQKRFTEGQARQQGLQAEWTELLKFADATIKETMTPLDRYAEKVEKLQQAFDAKLLNPEQFARGIAHAEKELNKLSAAGEKVQGSLSGSADAIAKVGDYTDRLFGNKGPDVARLAVPELPQGFQVPRLQAQRDIDRRRRGMEQGGGVQPQAPQQGGGQIPNAPQVNVPDVAPQIARIQAQLQGAFGNLNFPIHFIPDLVLVIKAIADVVLPLQRSPKFHFVPDLGDVQAGVAAVAAQAGNVRFGPPGGMWPNPMAMPPNPFGMPPNPFGVPPGAVGQGPGGGGPAKGGGPDAAAAAAQNLIRGVNLPAPDKPQGIPFSPLTAPGTPLTNYYSPFLGGPHGSAQRPRVHARHYQPPRVGPGAIPHRLMHGGHGARALAIPRFHGAPGGQIGTPAEDVRFGIGAGHFRGGVLGTLPGAPGPLGAAGGQQETVKGIHEELKKLRKHADDKAKEQPVVFHRGVVTS